MPKINTPGYINLPDVSLQVRAFQDDLKHLYITEQPFRTFEVPKYVNDNTWLSSSF